MRPPKPPALATWILNTFTPGARNEALAGDLFEELYHGRSAAWYWRQVFAAIAAGWLKDFFKHRAVLVFSVLWSALTPAWMLYIFNLEAHSNFIGNVWKMDWPWSTVCAFLLFQGLSWIFIWTGALVYLVPQMAAAKRFSIRRLGRGLLVSLSVYLIASAATFAVEPLLLHVHPVDLHALTPLSALLDARMWATVIRISCLFPLLCTLWETSSLSDGAYQGFSN